LNPIAVPARITGSMRLFLAAASLAVVLALPAGAGADAPTLFGSVGPGFAISLKDASGNTVTNLAPGTYTFQIDDKASEHNFHLTGPGVDMATGVDQIGMVTWTITLVPGRYHYQCDPHATVMKGDFTVGSGTTTTTTTTQATTTTSLPPAPAPVRLGATVSAGGIVTLTRAGAHVVSVKAGPAVIVVADRSTKANFHLVGPGVNRATSIPGTGTATWRLTLKPGVYKYGSGATASLRRSFRAA